MKSFAKISAAACSDNRMKLTHHRVLQSMYLLADWETGLCLANSAQICDALGWPQTNGKKAQVKHARLDLVRFGYLERISADYIIGVCGDAPSGVRHGAPECATTHGGVRHHALRSAPPRTGECATTHGGVRHHAPQNPISPSNDVEIPAPQIFSRSIPDLSTDLITEEPPVTVASLPKEDLWLIANTLTRAGYPVGMEVDSWQSERCGSGMKQIGHRTMNEIEAAAPYAAEMLRSKRHKGAWSKLQSLIEGLAILDEEAAKKCEFEALPDLKDEDINF